MSEYNNMTFLSHLKELRNRIITVLTVFLIILIITLIFSDKLLLFILDPLGNTKMIYISPPELLTILVKISVLVDLILVFPILLLEIFLFIKPAFTNKENIVLILIILFSIILLIFGICFGYFLMLPMSLKFFKSIEFANIKANFVLKNYIDYASSVIFMCGLAFQFPLGIIGLNRLNIISLKQLVTYRKYVLLVISIISAIITPPDVISQILILIPLMVLYELSILLIKVLVRKEKNE